MNIEIEKKIVIKMTDREYCDLINALINLRKQSGSDFPEPLSQLHAVLASADVYT